MARLLVAEDDEDLRELAHITLGKAGHDVVTAPDGKSAIALAKAADPPFDAVILDVAMPHMTGVEVVRRLRADPATEAVPILMVTAAIGDAATEAAFRAGADEYLTKPYRIKELTYRVEAMIARSRGETPRTFSEHVQPGGERGVGVAGDA